MRVALMALNAAGVSGVPRYTSALCRGIDAVAGEFPSLDLTLVTTPAGAEVVAARSMAVRKVGSSRVASAAARLLLEQAIAPVIRTEIVHYFDVTGPLLTPGRRFMLTFHDAAICHPDISNFGKWQRVRKQRLQPWSLGRAAAVVAVSEFAKREAIVNFGVDPARVSVVHSGPGLVSSSGGPSPGVTTGRRPYVLFVGNLTASKNIVFLVRAFDRADVPVDLVLAGRPVDAVAAIEQAVRASRGRERIRLVKAPSDADLDRLYRGATAFVFPSLYEGFGFPPLEAMARGCPVLASDIPALREILGAGALLLPLNEDVWVDAIRRVVADSGLRDDLREDGHRTVSRYSWVRAARETCRVFARVGSGGT